MKSPEKQLKIFKFTTFLFLVIILGTAVFSKKIINRYCPSPSKELLEKAKQTSETTIGKSFEFPINKNTKDKIKVTLIKANKVKMFVSNNQPVVGKENEEFILLFLEIENNNEYPVVLDSKNYFRLQDGEKRLSPDFYNGPVQVEAISSKKDNLGFKIGSPTEGLKLQVGEIEGKKEIVEIVFQ